MITPHDTVVIDNEPENAPVSANSTSDLVLVNSTALVNQGRSIAQLCREIVESSAIPIQGKRYIRVEGWQSIATAHGCVVSIRSVEKIDGGTRAIAELKRMSDGATLSTAEGFVGDDEHPWDKRQTYAVRAMAQTRAISRVCRGAFAHVVLLMNAGLSTTPAEEVPDGGFDSPEAQPKPVPRSLQRAFQGVAAARSENVVHTSTVKTPAPYANKRDDRRVCEVLPEADWFAQQIPFGKHKGRCLGDLPISYVTWLVGQRASGDFQINNSNLNDALDLFEAALRGEQPAPVSVEEPAIVEVTQAQPEAQAAATEDDDDLPF